MYVKVGVYVKALVKDNEEEEGFRVQINVLLYGWEGGRLRLQRDHTQLKVLLQVSIRYQ